MAMRKSRLAIPPCRYTPIATPGHQTISTDNTNFYGSFSFDDPVLGELE
jgi:hypothetical protein